MKIVWNLQNEYRAREVLEKNIVPLCRLEIFLAKENAEPEYETIDEEDVLIRTKVVEHITEEVKEGEEGEPKKESEDRETPGIVKLIQSRSGRKIQVSMFKRRLY